MAPHHLSRRAVLAAAAAAVTSTVAGCSDGRAQPSTAAPPASHTTTSTEPAQSPTPPTRPVGPAREITAGPRTGNAVALTFHGAGDPALTLRALTYFAAARASMTVLAVGTW